MSTPPRARLGRRLAGWTALATAVAVLVFAAAVTLVVWSREDQEARIAHDRRVTDATIDEDDDADVDEGPADQAIDSMIVPFLVTIPVVILLAVGATRLMARRVTDRLDEVVAAATRMTHEDLGDRLPVRDDRARDELDELALALNALFARLEEGLTAQKQFVADASHELRTPLTVLRSELEVARRRPRSAEEWEAVADRAHDEVARMTAMVEALLRLARADKAASGARIDARALVDDVTARWRSAADAAKVRLETHADEIAIAGDADALAVALGNLVGNAIAHSPAGGVVEVRARPGEGAHAELTVCDQGPGVPVGDRERIFLPFARGATAADRAGDGGVGLGLSVARRIVEAHHGDIAVDDAPGGGARFAVRLPSA